jgi:hypothetical protein
MEIIRDLAGGGKPSPINVFYNSEDDADGSEVRYKGSLVRLMDWDNANGIMFTGVGESVTLENIAGILGEHVGADGTNFLLNDASYGARTRKMYPLLPTSIVRGEYARADAAGTSNLDTNMTGTTTTITCGDALGVDDLLIGGWLYPTNGASANKLRYITDSANSGETFTLATSLASALVATDDSILVMPPHTLWMALDATFTGLLSEAVVSARTLPVVGLGTFISAPGIPYQRLDRNKHDGLTIANAKFYHEFIIGGSATLGNIWRDTVVRA